MFCFFFVVSCLWTSGLCLNYSREALEAKYPEYGTGWVPMGRTDDGELIIGYLDGGMSDARLGLTPEPHEVVFFTLYTRQHPNGTIIKKSIKNYDTIFDKNKPVKCITHGWMSSGKGDVCREIKDGFLKKYDANVFVIDWSGISQNVFYPAPMAATKSVGDYYSNLLNEVVELGVNPQDIHIVGHSLGAHVSGFAARGVKRGKIGRITGLDPALPGFNNIELVNGGRLSKTDAEFVDVIHTCAGYLGMGNSIGHADFYPNGGSVPQPGCENIFEMMEACSHGRSWKFFAESLTYDVHFMAYPCDSFESFVQMKECTKEGIPMGDPTPTDVRGNFYLKTENVSPFAIKDFNNDVDNTSGRR